MQQVARQVAVAVDNALNSEAARAYEEQLARERDRLRALLEINNAVVSCLATKQLFQAISASLRRTFGLDYASLLIYDAEAGALRLQMLDFPDGSGAIRENAVVPLDDSVRRLWSSAPARRRVFTPGRGRAAISPSTADIMAREGLQSLCCMPLISPAAVLGTLNLGSRQENFFTAAGSAILLAGRRPGGHRARKRALLQAHRGTERPACRKRRSTSKTKSAPTTASRKSSARAAPCRPFSSRWRPSRPPIPPS